MIGSMFKPEFDAFGMEREPGGFGTSNALFSPKYNLGDNRGHLAPIDFNAWEQRFVGLKLRGLSRQDAALSQWRAGPAA